MLEIVKNPKKWLTESFIKQWKLPIDLDIREISAEEFEPTVVAAYADETKYQELITAFLKLTEVSCLEKWFNASQLSKARNYSQINRDEVKRVKEAIDAACAEYEELLSEDIS